MIDTTTAAMKNQKPALPPTNTLQIQNVSKDEAFNKKPLHYVVKKWQDQIRANEKQFTESAEELREYELILIKSVAEIQKLEANSCTIKETYKENMRELQDVTLQ